MKIKFNTWRNTAALSLALLTFFASCKKDNSPTPTDPVIEQDFQLAFASGSGSISGTYLQGITDLTGGEISFLGKGYSMTSSRTARIFTSGNGSTVYSLNYTQGTIDKLTYHGGDSYTKLPVTFDSSIPLGAKATRFTKLNEQKGSVHYVASVPVIVNDEYQKHKITASIGILDLNDMNFGTTFNKDIDVVIPADLAALGYNITRIDAPVLSNGKLYYGAAVSKYNKNTAKNEATDKAFTLVIDYPSLSNATVIQTTLATGSTNGYRTPTQHVNEAGEILQMVSDGKGNTNILKIVNGVYHSTFKFNLSTALNKETDSNGWFYAGNGIGYMPYEKRGEAEVQIGVNPGGEPSYSSAWGLARIDLNNGTAIDLNTPAGLWLEQYQTSVVRNGKFYIALSPVGVQGNIYIFDVTSTSKDGVKGARISSGADQYYIGIY